MRIGVGFTYTKYNTLMHFLNVTEQYWQNPDLNSIQVFGKDVRALLCTACCQKIFFHEGHPGFYHYGPIMLSNFYGRNNDGLMDLAVTEFLQDAAPGVTASPCPCHG